MRHLFILIVLPLLCLPAILFAQPPDEQRQLIERILRADSLQRAHLSDVVLTATYVKGEENDKGQFTEKSRFVKRVSLKYLPDTLLLHEDYLECYKDGKRQSDRDCQKAAADDQEKKQRRRTPNVAYDMLRPFRPACAALYDIAYKGVAGERLGPYLCHHLTVTAKQPADTLINAEYFIDTATMRPVRVEFSPAQLVRRTMFKMSEMRMSLDYAPVDSLVWLPTEFHFRMKAKAMWVINVPTVATESYSYPIVNGGVPDSLFEVSHGK